MEFDGEQLRLDSSIPEDRLMMSDLLLTLARTIYSTTCSYYDDPEVRALTIRISEATPSRLNDRRTRPVLELSIDEIVICNSLIDPALETHQSARLPVDSMKRTQGVLKAILGHAVI